MLILKCDIEIGGWKLDFVTDVEITSGWDILTDTCVITIPRNITYTRNDEQLEDIFGGDNPAYRLNDLVVVRLGYGRGVLPVIFTGYITDVSVDTPVVIHCEDAMYFFKKTFVDLSRDGMEVDYTDLTLETLMNFVLGNTDLSDPFSSDTTFKGFQGESNVVIGVGDRAIGDVVINNIRIPVTTIARILDFLRKKYGIVSYFRPKLDADGNTIPDEQIGGIKQFFVCGLPYTTEDGFKAFLNKQDVTTPKYTLESESDFDSANIIKFEHGKNIIDDSDLVYKKASNIPVYIVANSKQKDNSVLTSAGGTIGGDVTTLNYPDQTQDQLDEFVANHLAKSRYEGFSGSFEAFLEPRVIHGQIVEMRNDTVKENNGQFLIKKVVTTFGTRGGRQIITVHNKIEDA